MSDNLTLEDLSNKSGLTLRTLRYYIQEGILQGPDTHGKFSRYSQQHLDRLELIQRLKNLRLPLQEIHHLLENMMSDGPSQVKQSQDFLKYSLEDSVNEMSLPEPQNKGESALEYIQKLERGRESVRSFSKPVPKPAPSSPSSSNNQVLSPQKENLNQETQETWSRTILQDGIELNIRYPKNVEEQKKIKQLISYAQNLFGDHI
ncbi:MAG: MerR family transcriptional regulator [Anaerolineaceae bacterium]